MNGKLVLKVESMHCGGCVSTVEKAVLATQGVASVKTDLGKKLVEVTGQVSEEEIIQAVASTGYEAVPFKKEEKPSLLNKFFKG